MHRVGFLLEEKSQDLSHPSSPLLPQFCIPVSWTFKLLLFKSLSTPHCCLSFFFPSLYSKVDTKFTHLFDLVAVNQIKLVSGATFYLFPRCCRIVAISPKP